MTPVPPARGLSPRPGRVRRALWGIAPIAASPSEFADPAARRRLRRAATVTGAMGLAWAATSAPHVAPGEAPAEASGLSEDALLTDDLVSPVGTPFASYLRDAREVQAAAAGTTTVAPAPADADPDAWRSHVLATFEDVTIVQPSADVPVVGFHEAGRGVAENLEPAARPDEELGRAEVEHGHEDDDLVTMVLPTRGRSAAPATAIDVAVLPGRRVHAPISGTVSAVSPYSLYGRHADHTISITPDGRPDLELVVLHVDDPTVAAGDRVEAGQTVIAGSGNALPFESQIDRFTREEIGRHTPHVHIELRRTGVAG